MLASSLSQAQTRSIRGKLPEWSEYDEKCAFIPDEMLDPLYRPFGNMLHLKERSYTPQPVWLEEVKGDSMKFRNADGQIATLATSALYPRSLEVHWDKYLERGEVSPFLLSKEQEEILKKHRLESFIYDRPWAEKEQRFYRQRGGHMGGKLPFLLYRPKGAGLAGRRFPLIIFLHGTGGQGKDNWRPLAEDGDGFQNHFGRLINSSWQQFMPCYVLVPQSNCPNNWWHKSDIDSSSEAVELTGLLTDTLMRLHPDIDQERLYITGLSGGGTGCYEMMASFPGKFAAIVPVAAYPLVMTRVNQYTTAPVWLFLNEHDPSNAWHKIHWALKLWNLTKVEHRITIYPGAQGHNAWTRVYEDGEFRTWLKKQKRRKDFPWPVTRP